MQNILVIKLGGGEGLDMLASCADIAQIARVRPVVVVHGVSARMEQLCRERGLESQVLVSPSGHSSRYTPPHIRELFVEASQQVNQEITQALNAQGVPAVSLAHAPIIQGERKDAIRAVVNGRIRVVRDDYSGSISGVNAHPLLEALQAGQVAVVPPLADSADGWLNVDGDRASAQIASALNAETLVILSNVRGLFRDFSNPDSLVAHVPAREIERAMDWAQGRMKRKVLGAQEALQGGVARVVIADGRTANPVARALNGEGTVFAS